MAVIWWLPGAEHAADLERRSLLDITGMIVGGRLSLSISYGRQYKKTTIKRLITSFEEHLERLIIRLSTEKEKHLTPVDLTYQQLDIDQLEQLNSTYSIEDIIP